MQVKHDLDEIAGQNRSLIAVFKVANQTKIDRCIDLLSKSHERLVVCSLIVAIVYRDA